MDDKYAEAEETAKPTKKVEVQETIPAEKPFEEQLDEAVGQSVEQFYKDVLKQADTRIKAQEEQIRTIQAQQLEFRDEIAVRCYVPLIDKFSTREKQDYNN
jgi:hypothetical protein